MAAPNLRPPIESATPVLPPRRCAICGDEFIPLAAIQASCDKIRCIGEVLLRYAMREAASALISGWRRLGRDLGFGAGIAQGYATLGQIGFSERSGYTAIGTVCNVAARLCAEAKDGQILMSQRVAARLNENITLEDIGALGLKGLTQPVVAYNVPLVGSQAALRVIEGGAPSA